MTRRGYAADTSVAASKSRTEIERLLSRHGCSQYGTAIDHDARLARVQFRAHDRIVRFEIGMPEQGKRNTDQLERQRWRQLLLVIKAKLESVENAIATFENEFMAHIVLPDSRVVSDVVGPLIAIAYKTGKVPAGFAALPAKGESSAPR